MLRVGVHVVSVVCVCVCGVACVVWHAENPCVSVQIVLVCTFKTSPCVPAPRAHVETHVRVMPAYTGMF